MTETLRAIPIDPAHGMLRQMIREYARLLDVETAAGRGVDAYHKLGPKLQAALREIGATPAGRRPAGGAAPADGGVPDELAAARARVASRARRAAGVDAPAP